MRTPPVRDLANLVMLLGNSSRTRQMLLYRKHLGARDVSCTYPCSTADGNLYLRHQVGSTKEALFAPSVKLFRSSLEHYPIKSFRARWRMARLDPFCDMGRRSGKSS
jgi:hypothetical protein